MQLILDSKCSNVATIMPSCEMWFETLIVTTNHRQLTSHTYLQQAPLLAVSVKDPSNIISTFWWLLRKLFIQVSFKSEDLKHRS